jgi:citrate lyase subunit alpha/citrate CoA-transferase
MMNKLERFVPTGYTPFEGKDYFKTNDYQVLKPKEKELKEIRIYDIDELFSELKLSDDMTFSFHHHLRNGDNVINLISSKIHELGIKNLTYAPSAIFPSYISLVDMIKDDTITKIYTNYINGPVARTVSEGNLKNHLIMQTHGGRPRAIECGEIDIDVAFIAVPAVDRHGNGNGVNAENACGVLGYAISDLQYAKKVVLVTDHIVDNLDLIEIDGGYVDYILKVDSIGDKAGIVSGTTQVTKDPVGLKIANLASNLIEELDLLKDGFSFQTGAGGVSLAVADNVSKKMREKEIKGSFASGGITAYMVEMLQNGLLDCLYDVQCFDHAAINSYRFNHKHYGMSASKYANPLHESPVVNDLDVVILGATEIDTDFNVNVTTDSFGELMGGSGGHSDTAYGANLTIITTPLMKSRIPIIKQKLTTITTPGSTVDALVTERGIAINPNRVDLLEKLKDSKLPIVPIEELMNKIYSFTGVPKDVSKTDEVIGVIEYRDGTVIDTIYKKG